MHNFFFFWGGGGGGGDVGGGGVLLIIFYISLLHQSVLTVTVVVLALEMPKKQATKFTSATIKKVFSSSYIMLRIQKLEGKQCGSRFAKFET